jgi:LuxR family transcriptional regulator, maltose regulon positive regulatory protein
MSKSAAKNIPKALRHELQRTALLEQLSNKTDFPVVALLAPSGYGKTTTLAQLARHGSRVVAWVTLTEEVASTDALGESVARALELALPSQDLSAWQAVRATSTTDAVKAQALATDLNAADMNVLLVLDRTEHLGANAAKWLEAFVNTLAEGHQVMLAGYESTPLPITGWVARGDAWLIGPNELAFSGEEVARFLSEHNPEINALTLHQQLEGWPAGIALVVAGAPTHLAPQDLVLERIAQLPERLQDGLIELAVTEEWGEATPQTLGVKLSRGWLKQVIALGLPLSPLGMGRYRAHTVLLEALEARLLERPNVHADRHARAAELADATGQKLTAIRHYLLAKKVSSALRVADDLCADLVKKRDYELVRKVLEGFESSVLPQETHIRLAEAFFETGNVDAGESILNGFFASGYRSAHLLFLLAGRANRRAQYQRQLDLIEEGLGLAPNQLTRAKLLLLRSDGQEYLGLSDESIVSAREAVVAAEQSGELGILAKATSRLAGALGNAGDRIACEQNFLRALEIYQTLGVERPQLDVFNNLANFYSEWGRVDDALKTVNQGLAIPSGGADSVRTALFATRGAVFLAWGYVQLALGDLLACLDLAKKHGIHSFTFFGTSLLAEAHHAIGDMASADMDVENAQRSLPKNSPMHASWLAFVLGVHAFLKSDFITARQHFVEVHIERVGFIYKSRALLFLAEIDRQNGQLSREQIDAIFALWNETDNDAPLMPNARVLKPLFETCIKNGWYAARFQAALNRTLEKPQITHQFELRMRTFGPASVFINQIPIKLPLVKCAELLAWLILNGPSTRNAIVNALWDGSRRKADVEHARIIIRRLRAALSEHPAVDFNPLEFDGTRYGLNPEFQIFCDAKSLLESSASASFESSHLEHLNAYSGSFLEGCDTDWVQETTTQLTDAAINSFVTLGKQYEVTQIEQVLEVYQRAIKLDPLAASAYEGIVRVQSQLGNTAAVQQMQTMLEQSEKRNLLN